MSRNSRVLNLCYFFLPVLILFTAGCQRDSKKTIAVIPKGNAHLFWQSVHAGAVKAARETGVDVIWNGPATEADFSGQLQIADAMMNRRPVLRF